MTQEKDLTRRGLWEDRTRGRGRPEVGGRDRRGLVLTLGLWLGGNGEKRGRDERKMNRR